MSAASPEERSLSPFLTVSAVVGGPTGAADSMAPPPLGWYVNTSPMLLRMLLSSWLSMLLAAELLPPSELVFEAKDVGGGGGAASCPGAAALALCMPSKTQFSAEPGLWQTASLC